MIRPTRRAVVLGTAAAAMLPLAAWAEEAPSQVRTLAADWLEAQHDYRCIYRDVFHSGCHTERLVHAGAERQRWLEAKRSLEHKTDRLISSPSVCRDDVVLKSAALGCFFAKERLPDSAWGIARAGRWIAAIESDVIAFNCMGLRTWRPEYETEMAASLRTNDAPLRG